jgi:hypothetical protein
MKRRSWKVWVAGIALVQALVIGADVAVLWPIPTEAERKAEMIQIGSLLSPESAEQLFGPSRWRTGCDGTEVTYSRQIWRFDDGSQLTIDISNRSNTDYSVQDVQSSPARPVPTLTRLRRTLARILPFLAE